MKLAKNKFFSISLIVLGCIIAVIAFPNVFIRPLLLNWFHSQYPGLLDFRISSLFPHQIILKDIHYTHSSFHQPLTIKSLKVSLKTHNYLPTLKSLNITDLKASFSDSSFSKDSHDLSKQAFSFEEISLILPELYFQNSQINYLSSHGNYTLAYNGFLNLNHDIKAEGTFSVSSDIVKLSGQLSIKGNPELLLGDLKCQQLEFPMHLKIPVQGHMSLKLAEKTLSFKGHLQDATQKLKVDTHGHYTKDKNIFLNTLTFDVKNIHDIIKETKIDVANIKHLDGNLHLEAKTTFSQGLLKSSGDLYLKNCYYKNETFEAKNIETKIHFTDFLNFTTGPHQKIKIKSLTLGLPFENIEGLFQLQPDFSLFIEKITSDFQGGDISLSPLKLTSPYRSFAMDVTLKNILVQNLITLADIKELTMTGGVDGKISATFDEGDYSISKDSFIQMNPDVGKILYRPKSSETLPHKIKYFKGNESPTNLIYLALWNFHYTHLKVNIEKPLHAELIAYINLKGYNPDMFKGHPFDFNIKAKGGLIQLIEQTFNKLAES